MKEVHPLKKNIRLDQNTAEEREMLEKIRAAVDVSYLRSSDVMFLARRRARRELLIWAERVADRFWEVHYRHRNGDGVEREFGGFGVRITERAWTISIEWNFSQGRGKNLPPRTEYIHLPAGSMRLSRSQLRRAKGWELEAILEAEEEFEKIRRCSEQLKTITRAYLGFSQILGAGTDYEDSLLTWNVEG